MVRLCVCDAMSIVAIDGGDGDIVERRAKAIRVLDIHPARWSERICGRFHCVDKDGVLERCR